jgi:ketosteroid isomerase-like protein
MTHCSAAAALVCAMLLSSSALAGPQPGSEAAIRAADQDWLRVYAAKDLEKSVDVCAQGCEVLAPNAPRAVGRAAIRDVFKSDFALPDMKIVWTPTEVRVVKSGEVGYSSGPYQQSFRDPQGKIVTDHGKYVTIWRLEHGRWKVALDMFNTDLPEH